MKRYFFAAVLITTIFLAGAGLQAQQKKRVNFKSFLESVKVSQDQPTSKKTVSKKALVRYKPKSEKEVRIEDIELVGCSESLKPIVMDEINIKPGDDVLPVRFETMVRNLNSLGLFQDVSYRLFKKKDGVLLRFEFVENPTLSDIRFEGAKALTQEQLKQAIHSKQGDILNRENVKKDVYDINAAYEKAGYTDSRVVGVKLPDAAGDPLVFEISEKRIEAITITGNRVTKPYVILREMQLKPGSILHGPTLKEDLRRIYNLNYFSELKPNFLPGSQRDTMVLDLNLAERPSFGSFTIGGGYGATSGLSFFSNIYAENLFGTGQLVALNSQIGNISNTYQFKYYNPWMWDERKSFSFKTWYRDGSIEGVNPLTSSGLGFIGQRSTGVEVAVGIPFSYQFKTTHALKHENVLLTSVNRTYRVQSYTFGMSYDTRDVWFNPTEGDFYTLSIERAYPFVSDGINFTKYDLDLRHFIKTFDQQTIALRVALGLIESPEINDTTLFAREYYRMGGSNSVRGYDEFHPFAVGEKQAIVSAEYRFLFTDVFQLIFFVDAGYASRYRSGDDNTYNERVEINQLYRYRVGKGIGTRINIPMLGPLRLDFGINDEGNSRFHFNIGHSF